MDSVYNYINFASIWYDFPDYEDNILFIPTYEKVCFSEKWPAGGPAEGTPYLYYNIILYYLNIILRIFVKIYFLRIWGSYATV